YLTFVDRALVGWRFPPDRQLTAEAEQRRLDAMEQRMMTQLREMEQRSIERHQAEMTHLNSIQQNQQQIRSDIANTRRSVLDAIENMPPPQAQAPGSPGAQPGQPGQPPAARPPGQRPPAQRPPPQGCQTFTINGTTYSDRHGTPMGQPCGSGCPNGYACVMPLGRCMPVSPERRCP
ncbi:MAG: hypothetical protein AAGE52_27895, partial [Myxococcota bacterium]